MLLSAIALSAIGVYLGASESWQPLGLFAALLALGVLSDLYPIRIGRLYFSFTAAWMGIAMALLGPGPAMAIAACGGAVDAVKRRTDAFRTISNLVANVAFGLAGGMFLQGVGADGLQSSQSLATAALVPCAVLLAEVVSFAVVGVHLAVTEGRTRRDLLASAFLPTLPAVLMTATAVGIAVYAYRTTGLTAFVAACSAFAVIVFLFRNVAELQHQRAETARLAEERRALLLHSLEAQARERASTAELLHDEVVQLLVMTVQRGNDPDGNVRRALDALRKTLSELHPVVLEYSGLEAALAAVIRASHFEEAAIQLHLPRELARDRDPLMFAACRELLVNAIKHSGAGRIRVEGRVTGSERVVEVSDDGCGCDAASIELAVRQGHLGLALTRQRVEAAGGSLTIDNPAAGGTRAEIRLPQEPSTVGGSDASSRSPVAG